MFLRYVQKTKTVNYAANTYTTNTNGVVIIYDVRICKHYYKRFNPFIIMGMTFVKNAEYIKIIMYGPYQPKVFLTNLDEQIMINYEFDGEGDICRKWANYDFVEAKTNFTGAHHDLLRYLRSISVSKKY